MQPIPTENTVQQPITQEQTEKPADNNVEVVSTQLTTEEKQEDPNWRAFREARKKDRIMREEAERKAREKEAEVEALKAAMEAAFSRQHQSSQQPEYGYEEETEDQRIQKKIDAALAVREQQYRQEAVERERQEYPTKLTSNFPDFNDVVNQETLDYLDYHYKEIARPLQRLPEGYDKWADIYFAIKKLMPNAANAKKDSQRAEINQNKPRSMSSPGAQTPTPEGSHILTKERREQNWQRMQKLLKGVS